MNFNRLAPHYHWLEIIFAGLKIGAVLVPLNYRLAPEEIAAIFGWICEVEPPWR